LPSDKGKKKKIHVNRTKDGGNPGNLTRLNGFRVHLINMIRFPFNQM